MLKGNAYAFKELSDRVYGKMKETVAVDVNPYRRMSDEDLKARIKQLEAELGYAPALPSASEDPKTKPAKENAPEAVSRAFKTTF